MYESPDFLFGMFLFTINQNWIDKLNKYVHRNIIIIYIYIYIYIYINSRFTLHDFSIIHCILPRPLRFKKKLYVGMPWTIMHVPTEEFFLLGTGGKCNELLIIYCIFFVFLYLGGGGGRGAATYPSPRCVRSWISG